MVSFYLVQIVFKSKNHPVSNAQIAFQKHIGKVVRGGPDFYYAERHNRLQMEGDLCILAAV